MRGRRNIFDFQGGVEWSEGNGGILHYLGLAFSVSAFGFGIV